MKKEKKKLEHKQAGGLSVGAALCAHPGRYELHVWYPKSFPSHSSAPSWRYPSPQWACLHSAVRGEGSGEKKGLGVATGPADGEKMDGVTGVADSAAALTDAAVGDDPVPVVALLPVGDLNDAVATVAFVVRGVFHGLEWRQLEWKHLWRKDTKKNQVEL